MSEALRLINRAYLDGKPPLQDASTSKRWVIDFSPYYVYIITHNGRFFKISAHNTGVFCQNVLTRWINVSLKSSKPVTIVFTTSIPKYLMIPKRIARPMTKLMMEIIALTASILFSSF